MLGFLKRMFGGGGASSAPPEGAASVATPGAPAAVAPESVAAAVAPTKGPPAGDLGAYALDELLGKGGMGEVWRGRRKADGAPVAVKVIRDDGDLPPDKLAERQERFRREATSTSQLTSPHAIRIFDFGATDDGRFFYAMELLEGQDLDKLVRAGGPLGEERVARLIAESCDALDEAHRVGLVHRDIKPENVFVARVNGRETAKVLDFGLVKLLEAGSDGSIFDRGGLAKLTAAAQTPGTPAFMAPEQVKPGAAIDHRADIYALACVAYFALTGQPVFEGRMETQLMFAHLHADPDPPSEKLGKPVHAGLEALILKNLAKSPDDRCQTMGELGRELRALGVGA